MIKHTIDHFLNDVSIIQHYIKNSQDAGFGDMARLLESLSIHTFKISHGLSLSNKNILFPNFPAIDLADDNKRTAVQVTINADATKIKHTLKMFQDHNLKVEYDTLIIHGFVSCRKPKNLPQFCSVIKIGELAGLVCDKNDENAAQELLESIQTHTDYAKIHPYHDASCLAIILNCIDRNAIKHRMSCEGNYTDMIDGLKEISEIISKGTIKKKSKGKSLDDFNDNDIKIFLRCVRDEIGKIEAIINTSRCGNADFVCISQEGMWQIDNTKRLIIELANKIAQAKNIDFNMTMI
jgi:hypothetical protein